MNRILLFFIFFISLQYSFCQTQEESAPASGEIQEDVITIDENTIYNIAGIEIKPEFIGGMNEFHKFVAKNFIIPKDFHGNGKILVNFVIEKDGSVTDIKVLRDTGFETGIEAKRVLKLSPKWKPGIQNNKKVRVNFTVPIVLSVI